MPRSEQGQNVPSSDLPPTILLPVMSLLFWKRYIEIDDAELTNNNGHPRNLSCFDSFLCSSPCIASMMVMPILFEEHDLCWLAGADPGIYPSRGGFELIFLLMLNKKT